MAYRVVKRRNEGDAGDGPHSSRRALGSQGQNGIRRRWSSQCAVPELGRGFLRRGQALACLAMDQSLIVAIDGSQ